MLTEEQKERIRNSEFVRIDAPLPEWAQEIERQLIERIEELRREYELRAKPYIDQLAKLEAHRPLRWHVVPKSDEKE